VAQSYGRETIKLVAGRGARQQLDQGAGREDPGDPFAARLRCTSRRSADSSTLAPVVRRASRSAGALRGGV
jgi:hypothetical protein